MGQSGGRKVTSGTEIPAWVTDQAKSNLAFANQVANRAYRPYTGPRVAGFTDDQTRAQDMARSQIGAYRPMMQKAAGYADPDGAQAFMNPYQRAVTDTALADIERQRQIQQQGVATSAARAGAFGGSRHGVAEAETNRAFADQAARTTAQLNQQGYAQAQAASQQAAGLTAALAAHQQQLGQQDVAGLAAIGAQQQELNQRNLSLAYEDFLKQQNHPLEQLNIRMAALGSTPYSSKSYSVRPADPFGDVQQGAGAGLALLDLFSRMKS